MAGPTPDAPPVWDHWDTPDPRPPAKQLSTWLMSLVHTSATGTLADLRRDPGRARTAAHMRAAAFTGTTQETELRDIYKQTAFLFAIYHRGAGRAAAQPGLGSMGAACSRIGTPTARGRNNEGAVLLFSRLISSRRIPWRHLQHAVERCRACSRPAPNWEQLADDLARWTERGTPVPDQWAIDFYTPTYAKKIANTPQGDAT